MNMIFSADRNWAIGNCNRLLYRIPSDLKRFRNMTEGNVVVMGHNTFLSLPDAKPLSNRVNIVLSRKPGLQIEGTEVCDGLEALFEEIKRYPEENVFVIGGEQIYRLLMPYCERAYVTKIDEVAEADSFVENLDENSGWKVLEESDTFEESGVTFKYVTYIQLDYSPILP